VKRRVTFVLPSLHGGGAERAAVILLNGLARRDYDATLYVFARQGAYFDQVANDVRVIVGSPGRISRLRSLRRFLSREPQDVVVSFLSHFTTYAAFRTASPASKYAISQQTPLSAFLDDHDYGWRHPMRRRLFTAVARSVYPRVDGIAATSRGVADDLNSHYGVDRSRIAVIPNPVDIETVQRAAREAVDPAFERGQVPTIVTAGRLAHAKNLPLLIDALQHLSRRMAFRAWILGAGDLENDVRALITRASLQQHVALLGFQANPWKFMARADVFVLTSRYEGFGNVLIEAMSCGLPVVATSSYGTRDIVRDDAGILVERHDPAAVAAALERMLADPPLRACMASAARAAAVEFSVPTVVDQFDAFLGSLLAA
jgi:glycosyltransferase involved in cell wall biosynthesis